MKHKNKNYMGTYYRLDLIDIQTEIYIFETHGSKMIVEDDKQFSIQQARLAEEDMDEKGAVEITASELDDYVDNMNAWMQSVVGSHPPKAPK